jgi:hypothetical protein
MVVTTGAQNKQGLGWGITRQMIYNWSFLIFLDRVVLTY